LLVDSNSTPNTEKLESRRDREKSSWVG